MEKCSNPLFLTIKMNKVTFQHGSKTRLVVYPATTIPAGETPTTVSSILAADAFYLPRDADALITMLRYSAHLYQPVSPDAVGNLKVLVRAFGGEGPWIDQLIDQYIDNANHTDNAAMLCKWREMLAQVPIVRKADAIDAYIRTIMDKLNVIADLDVDLLKESERMFTTKKRTVGHDVVLTETRLTGGIASSVAAALGQKYDVHKMLNLADWRESAMRAKVHRGIMLALQNHGFVQTGLIEAGQQLFESNDKNLSKAKIDAFFANPSTQPVAEDPYRRRGVTPAPALTAQQSLVRAIASVIEMASAAGSPLAAETAEVKGYSDVLVAGTDAKKVQLAMKKVPKWIFEHIAVKSKYTQYSGDEKRLTLAEAAPKWVLDEWQQRFYDMVRTGESCIAATPTTAGKTFIAMSSINQLIDTDVSKLEWLTKARRDDKKPIIIVYVAPSFDLALQTYNNVKATFAKPVSLVTARVSEIVKDTQIWIGTPSELWVYFVSMDISYDIGYFDEVHTISLNYGTGRETQLRAEATANLMTKCRHQFIGLSATIHDEDIPRLCEYASRHTGHKIDLERNVIVYRQRPIPQSKHLWVGGGYIPETEAAQKALIEGAVYPVTPESTFLFLHQLLVADHAPALIFDMTAEQSWNNYESYVKWLVDVDATNYAGWHRAKEKVEANILKFNDEVADYQSQLGAAHGNAKLEAALKSRAMKYIDTRRGLIENIKREVEKAITEALSDETRMKRQLVESEVRECKRAKVKVDGVTPKVGDYIAVEVPDLAKVWADLVESAKSDNVAGVSMICEGVGPYYRMGAAASGINEMKAMFDPRMMEKGEQYRKQMLELCQAERIREEEVKPLFKLIIQGIEFGVGIIVPTMPFVVHYNMLKLMAKKSIPMIFSSLDMSMGINYPIRTVCLRANTPTEMNICEYLQAAGRSGRRRFDTEGYVVSWNILNALSATQANLPLIELPEVKSTGGCQIENPLALAMEIERGRIYSIDDSSNSSLTQAITRMGGGSVRTKAAKAGALPIPGAGDDDLGDDDEEGVYRGPAKVTHTESRGIDDEALISSVMGCVGPLSEVMGINPTDLLEIAERIRRIALNQITEDMSTQAYEWARKIGLIKIALQELHTKMHTCIHEEWLQYIEAVYELIHRAQLRQMRLS